MPQIRVYDYRDMPKELFGRMFALMERRYRRIDQRKGFDSPLTSLADPKTILRHPVIAFDATDELIAAWSLKMPTTVSHEGYPWKISTVKAGVVDSSKTCDIRNSDTLGKVLTNIFIALRRGIFRALDSRVAIEPDLSNPLLIHALLNAGYLPISDRTLITNILPDKVISGFAHENGILAYSRIIGDESKSMSSEKTMFIAPPEG